MSNNLLKLDIDGMTCAACATSVERIIADVGAVKSVAVNLPLNAANILLDEAVNQAIVRNIIEKICSAGFTAKEQNQTQSPRTRMAKQVTDEGRKAALALILALPTIYVSMFANDMGDFVGFETRLLLAFFMTLPVYFWSGMTFHKNAWKAIKRGAANMDVLIHLSTSVAFFWSVGVTLGTRFSQIPNIFKQAEHVFFDGVVFIIGFVLIGNYLEAVAKLKATDSIHSLMTLQPNQARIVHEADYTEMIPVGVVKPESIIKVLIGETIPIDGILEDCKASIDESTMTGEAYPVSKKAGDQVYAGTIVLDGTIFVRTTTSADDTLLSNIIKLVEDAQTGKAPIQRFVDRVSAVFVPIVVILAVSAGLFWALIGHNWVDNPMNSGFELALMVVISTLVIACPCALGLATPIALVVGTSVGAKHGLLIKGIDALEAAHGCDVMVVDKTGTITSGKPKVSHIEIIDCEVKEILAIAAALEQEANHPLSEAIIKSWSNLTEDSPLVKDIQAMPGMGMIGKLEGQLTAIGNQKLMREVGIDFSEEMNEKISKVTSKGRTIAFVCLGSRLLGWIELRDYIRNTSSLAVKRAKQMDIEVIMLTGDNQNSAATIAEKIGLETVIAEVKPNEKAEKVIALQAQGNKVIMIGDGINDAAALTVADVGIAMGAGSDIALDAADFVLVRNDLVDAVSSLHLSKATMRTVRTNLIWAFSYNLLGIPLAMGVLLPSAGLLLPPAFAAAAMALSSVSVVTNSLTLRWWKPINIE